MPSPVELKQIANEARAEAKRQAETERRKKERMRDELKASVMDSLPEHIEQIDAKLEAEARRGGVRYTWKQDTEERDRDIYDPLFLSLLSHYQEKGFWAEIRHNPGSEWSGLMDPSLIPTGVDHRTFEIRWDDDSIG